MSSRRIPSPGKGTKTYFHNSDSGVGSFSDHDNYPTRPDRLYVDDEFRNIADPWEQIRVLKLHVKSLEADNATKDRVITETYKNTREAQGRNQQLQSQVQGLFDRIEVLEEDLKKAHRERKRSSADSGIQLANLQNDNKNLQNENLSLNRVVGDLQKEIQREINENKKLSGIIALFEQRSPVNDHMSGANPEVSRKHRKSSDSKKSKEKEREKDREDKALHDRLAARLGKPGEEEPRRGRRSSVYKEPFGPGGRTKRSSSAAPPSRAFQNVAYQRTTEPRYSEVPRRPESGMYRRSSNQGWDEDGNYHDYPLNI